MRNPNMLQVPYWDESKFVFFSIDTHFPTCTFFIVSAVQWFALPLLLILLSFLFAQQLFVVYRKQILGVRYYNYYFY